jgi:hypothetical protein
MNISKVTVLIVSLVFVVTACSSQSNYTASQALDKLKAAGIPCEEKTDFGALSRGPGFACHDFEDSFTGYRMSFGESSEEFTENLLLECSEMSEEGLAVEGVFGVNWVATVDSGSLISLAEIQSVLGGSTMTFSEACSSS